jgi:hypothetical protein
MSANWLEAFFFFPQVLGLFCPSVAPRLNRLRHLVLIVPIAFGS